MSRPALGGPSWSPPETQYARSGKLSIAYVAWRAPTELDNPAFVRRWGSYRRLGASPGAAADLTRMNARIDVRELLSQVDVPTLVLARERDRVITVDHARFVAGRIPGAAYLELSGEDHLPFVGDASAVVNAIARMLGVEEEISIDDPTSEIVPSELSARGIAEVLILYLQPGNLFTPAGSDVVLRPPGPGFNFAFGNCSLSVGQCTFSGGLGTLRWFQAVVAVSYLSGVDWAWDGTYGFGWRAR